MINAIILVGGASSRFKALSHYHKPLLPFKNKEFIRHVLDSLLPYHFGKIVIVVSRNNKDSFASFINKHYSRELIEIVVQDSPGVLGAFRDGLVHCDSEHVLLHLGDVLTSDELKFSNDFLSVQTVEDFSRWCMVSDDCQFFDKPITRPPTNKALSGLYFFTNTNEILHCCNQALSEEQKSEYQLSQALKLYTRKFDLRELNIIDNGTINDFLIITGHKSARFFNNVSNGDEFFVKSSSDEKLLREFWHLKALNNFSDYKAINPVSLSLNRPVFKMTLPKVNFNSLDYYFVIENLELEEWEQIFSNLLEHIRIVNKKYAVSRECFDLKNIAINRGLFDYSHLLNNKDSVLTYGDYHLGNIFYDLHDNNFQVCDASGRFYHLKLYDIAKLVHSVLYDYCVVKFNLYKIEYNKVFFYNEHLNSKRELFVSLLKKYCDDSELLDIKKIVMILFYSMQSLHNELEHRQIFGAIHKQLLGEITRNDPEFHSYKELEL